MSSLEWLILVFLPTDQWKYEMARKSKVYLATVVVCDICTVITKLDPNFMFLFPHEAKV